MPLHAGGISSGAGPVGIISTYRVSRQLAAGDWKRSKLLWYRTCLPRSLVWYGIFASPDSSWKLLTAASICDMAAFVTPWFTTWKKPTVSVAAFTLPTTSARWDGVHDESPPRSITGMAKPS
jgi:hypothetical protein